MRLLRTTSSGHVWTELPSPFIDPVSHSEREVPEAIGFIADGRGVVFTTHFDFEQSGTVLHRLLRTEDGGLGWTEEPIPDAFRPLEVAVVP